MNENQLPEGASEQPQPENETAEAFISRLRDWQLATFPGETIPDVYRHLREEVDELGTNPGDSGELADVLMLAMCLCFHHSIDPIAAIRQKHAVNLERKWKKTEKGFRQEKPQPAVEGCGHSIRKAGCPNCYPKKPAVGALDLQTEAAEIEQSLRAVYRRHERNEINPATCTFEALKMLLSALQRAHAAGEESGLSKERLRWQNVSADFTKALEDRDQWKAKLAAKEAECARLHAECDKSAAVTLAQTNELSLYRSLGWSEDQLPPYRDIFEKTAVDFKRLETELAQLKSGEAEPNLSGRGDKQVHYQDAESKPLPECELKPENGEVGNDSLRFNRTAGAAPGPLNPPDSAGANPAQSNLEKALAPTCLECGEHLGLHSPNCPTLPKGKLVFAAKEGSLDLEAMAKQTVRNYCAYFSVGGQAQECLQELITEALQQARAGNQVLHAQLCALQASADAAGKAASDATAEKNRVRMELDEVRVEVERLKADLGNARSVRDQNFVILQNVKDERDSLHELLAARDAEIASLTDKLGSLQVQSDAAHQLLSQFQDGSAEAMEWTREDLIEIQTAEIDRLNRLIAVYKREL